MLPSYQQIWPIFATWHFALYEVINITFNMLFNILNVYLSRRHQKPPFKFIDVSLLWTVSLYTLIMALFMFAFSFDIHKRIREEKAHPVARAALRNTRFKRIFFWGICETNWKKRLPKFIVCCIVCCAIPVTLFFWCLCLIVAGPSPKNPCTASSLWHLIGYDAWWKAMCTFVIVAVNYVACHNDEAPEVQPRESKGGDDDSAKSEETCIVEGSDSVCEGGRDAGSSGVTVAVNREEEGRSSLLETEQYLVRREGKGMLQEESSSLLAGAAPPPVRYNISTAKLSKRGGADGDDLQISAGQVDDEVRNGGDDNDDTLTSEGTHTSGQEHCEHVLSESTTNCNKFAVKGDDNDEEEEPQQDDEEVQKKEKETCSLSVRHHRSNSSSSSSSCTQASSLQNE